MSVVIYRRVEFSFVENLRFLLNICIQPSKCGHNNPMNPEGERERERREE
jgi:hypothetical protein